MKIIVLARGLSLPSSTGFDVRQSRLQEWYTVNMQPFDPQEFADRVLKRHRNLCRRLPDLDPGDILLILQQKMRPFGTGKRFFIRKHPDGGYVI